MSKNIVRNEDGTWTVVLRLKEDEWKQLKKLANKLGMNDFEAVKYSVQLVSWWSRNEIEPEQE